MGKTGKPTELGHAMDVSNEVMLSLSIEPIRSSIVCGSVRRFSPVVSDVDIAVELNDGDDLTVLEKHVPNIRWTKASGTAWIDGVLVEIYRAPRDCMGATIQFLTGPGDFNVYLRMRAKKYGWRLSQYGLIEPRPDDEPDVRIDVPTGDPFEDEQRIFQMLEVEYLDPPDRTVWRQCYGK